MEHAVAAAAVLREKRNPSIASSLMAELSLGSPVDGMVQRHN